LVDVVVVVIAASMSEVEAITSAIAGGEVGGGGGLNNVFVVLQPFSLLSLDLSPSRLAVSRVDNK
jgi:hypothetical protein